MRRGIILLILGAMLLLVPSAYADGSWSFELVAGQHTPIGTVNVVISGSSLTATYNVTAAGWCMTSTHFYAGSTPPSNAPGQFNYKHDHADCVTTDSFSVPTPAGNVYVAAHADSDFDPERASEPTDPLSGTAIITPSTGGSSYFTVATSGGVNGTYAGWCIDLSHFITPGVTYTANVYEEGGAGLVDFPDNLDLVNYVLNQDYSVWGATVMDVQTAIWLLIDNDVPVMITAIARDIEADARANGEGFVAGCGGVMGVIVEPIENNAQHLILEYPAPCPIEGEARQETAWALASWGTEFGQGWGMYFWLQSSPDEEPSEEPTPAPTEPSNGGGDNGNGGGGNGNGNANGNANGNSNGNSADHRNDASNGGSGRGNGGNNSNGNSQGNANGRGN